MQRHTEVDVLIQKAIRGDRRALESLLAHFHDPLLHYIHGRRLRHNITGIGDEDVLQDTLMEAFGHIRSLQAQGSAAFFAWLKTIARHRMVNLVKAMKAQKRGGHLKQIHAAPSDATVTTIINLVAGKEPTPSWIARNRETVQAIGRALADLNDNRRQAMELRFGKGMSMEEIAAQMGLGEGAVKMHINRSIKELRAIFVRDATPGKKSM